MVLNRTILPLTPMLLSRNQKGGLGEEVMKDLRGCVLEGPLPSLMNISLHSGVHFVFMGGPSSVTSSPPSAVEAVYLLQQVAGL